MPISSGANPWPKSYWTGRPVKEPPSVRVRMASVSGRLSIGGMESGSGPDYQRHRTRRSDGRATSLDWGQGQGTSLPMSPAMPNVYETDGGSDNEDDNAQPPPPPPVAAAPPPAKSERAGIHRILVTDEAIRGGFDPPLSTGLPWSNSLQLVPGQDGRERSRSAVCRQDPSVSSTVYDQRVRYSYSKSATGSRRANGTGQDAVISVGRHEETCFSNGDYNGPERYPSSMRHLQRHYIIQSRIQRYGMYPSAIKLLTFLAVTLLVVSLISVIFSVHPRHSANDYNNDDDDKLFRVDIIESMDVFDNVIPDRVSSPCSGSRPPSSVKQPVDAVAIQL